MAFQDRAYNGFGGAPSIHLALPPVTRLTMTLIIACLMVFLLQVASSAGAQIDANSRLVQFASLTFADRIALSQPWRLITYQYLHASTLQVVFNMIALFFFLPPLEKKWGWQRALAFYTAGGIAAGLAYGVMGLFTPLGPLVGASGSIMACLGACALLVPEMTLLGILPIRLAALFVAFLYMLAIVGDRNVADAAHLGGLAFGAIAPCTGARLWKRMHRNWQHQRVLRAAREELEENRLVDRILQKVSEHGLPSLTWTERRTLRRATIRRRQRDAGPGLTRTPRRRAAYSGMAR